MTGERALPTEPAYGSVWKRIVANHRLGEWPFARDVGLPILAFLGPLLVIVLVQCNSFGCGLLLGWDSSTYAWWAVLVQEKGAPAMVLQWNYPHLYVLLLSAVGSLLGSVSVAEHILPLLVSVPLGYSYFGLTRRVTNDRRLGLFAAFLGGVSMATVEMVSDLQRNLLAFGIALPLGASIYTDIFGRARSRKQLRNTALAIWIPLLFVVLSTQIETYAVLSIALLLAFASPRKWSTFLQGLLLVSVPVVLASPIMIGYLLRYGAETSKLLPGGPFEAISWTWLYLSGFAIPLIGVGIVSLTRLARSHNPVARYLVLWLIALAILVPPAIAIHVPPTRLLLFVPVPVLLAIAVPDVSNWIEKTWKWLRSREARIAPIRSDPPARPDSAPPFSERRRWAFSLLLAFLLAATPVVVTTAMNKDQMRPYITEADVQRLRSASAFVHQDAYRDAIIVLYGKSAALFAPLYRAYFGIEVPVNFAYYGKLQFLFSLPDPALAYVWKYDQRTEPSYSTNYRDEILTTIGAAGISARPIVVAGGATYSAAPSESFLSRFQRAPGIYIIPPGALTALEIDTWRLYAASDCFVCVQGSSVSTNWSRSPTVLEYVDLSSSAVFDSTYALSLVRGWGSGNLTVRFWDWPGSLPSPTGASVVLAPLEVYLDGNRILNHYYTDLGALSLSVPTGPLAAGIHRVVVKSGSSGMGVAVSLDDLNLAPSS